MVFQEPVINCMSEDGAVIEGVQGDLKFENVHFSYPSREEVKVSNLYLIRINVLAY